MILNLSLDIASNDHQFERRHKTIDQYPGRIHHNKYVYYFVRGGICVTTIHLSYIVSLHINLAL
jgi:hypothetical protein